MSHCHQSHKLSETDCNTVTTRQVSCVSFSATAGATAGSPMLTKRRMQCDVSAQHLGHLRCCSNQAKNQPQPIERRYAAGSLETADRQPIYFSLPPPPTVPTSNWTLDWGVGHPYQARSWTPDMHLRLQSIIPVKSITDAAPYYQSGRLANCCVGSASQGAHYCQEWSDR
jgi:hypothetical protein